MSCNCGNCNKNCPTIPSGDCKKLKQTESMLIDDHITAAGALDECSPSFCKDVLQWAVNHAKNVSCMLKNIINQICMLWCIIRCLNQEMIKLYEKVYDVSKISFQSNGSGLTWVSNTGTPAWSSGDNYKNPATWTSVADVNHSNYWLNINDEGTQAAFHMQYGGEGHGWASARFIEYSLTITNQKYNDDHSLYVEYELNLGYFKGHATDVGGISVKYDIKMQSKTEWTFSGDTGDDFDIAPQDEKITGSATIPVGGSHTGALIDFYVSYPNGEFSPNNFKIGMVINNPDVPDCLQGIDFSGSGDCTDSLC